MGLDDGLPKYQAPPVDEVALGVQFSLKGFLPTHFGAFHARIKADFPGVQTLPPLPPIFEVLTQPSRVVGTMHPAAFPWALPRILFVSADDCSLIQVQADRLVFNWRRRPNYPEYPNYRGLREGFFKAYSEFVKFLSDEGVDQPEPNLCEVLYTNPIDLTQPNGMRLRPSDIFRIWNSDVGPEWLNPLEDLAFNARYELADTGGQVIGRLTANMSTSSDTDGKQAMRLEMTARGTPVGAGIDGIQAFHDLGRSAIVRSFTALTTKTMHDHWKRYQ
jgi:uncharacterized protein (TIGR04255 family)